MKKMLIKLSDAEYKRLCNNAKDCDSSPEEHVARVYRGAVRVEQVFYMDREGLASELGIPNY